jgi:hypothetical protein
MLEAHAYVYGGAIIQDLGCDLFGIGSQFFSDLTHYVRTGDFVIAFIEEPKDLNEYAFAPGALVGTTFLTLRSPLATNRSVGLGWRTALRHARKLRKHLLLSC